MKLTSNQIWEMAQGVAVKLDGICVENMSKEDFAKYDERCNALVELPSQNDGKDYDEIQTLDYFKTLVKFHVAAHEAGYKVEPDGKDPSNIVKSLVEDILDKDNLDNTEVTDVQLDDNGNCIYVTFAGAVSASTIIAIGKEFGDDDPNVYSNGRNSIQLVFVNENHEELIGK